MLMKHTVKNWIEQHRSGVGEVLRFGVVGLTATLVQYATYLILLRWLSPPIANTVAYFVSFLFNYIASVKYTFKVRSTARKGAGFIVAHAVNYTLQTLLLMLFIWLGLQKQWALLPVFCICVPLNFLLVRYFLKR